MALSVVVFAVGLPLLVLGVVVALARRAVLTVGVNEHPGAVAIATHTRGWRVVGLLVGAVAALGLLVLGERFDALGRLTMLAPTVLGVGVLVGTTVGELTARPPVGIRREVAVERRTVRGLVPRGRVALLGVSGALLLGLLALATAWGSPDDMGRAGRWFSQTCEVVLPDLGPTTMGSSRGPWPGSFYAVPLVVALGVVAVLLALALRAVVNRPRPELESRGLDTLLRRWSAVNVVTAATVTVLGTLGAVAFLVANALGGGGCQAGATQTVVQWLAVAVAPLATGLAFGLLAGLVVTPTIRVDDLPRPTPGDAAPVGAPVR